MIQGNEMLSVSSVIDNWVGPYEFLRNDYFCEIEVEEDYSDRMLIFPSVEHAFQAAKTNDFSVKEEMEEAATAAEAKAIGRGVLLPHDWGTRRVEVMRDLIEKKFRDPDLAQKLLDTGSARLVMVSSHDTFWGQDKNGSGQNMLGTILMEVRDYLANFSPNYVVVGTPSPLVGGFKSTGSSGPSLVDVATKVVEAFGKGNSSLLASVIVTKIENNPDEYARLIQELAEAIKRQ